MGDNGDNKEKTIKDVAVLAGVSVATVGRVIGNYGSVSEKTRDKVMNAVRELNYSPNAIAQGMRGRSMKTIGIVIGSIKNSFFGEMVYAIERVARKNGYNTLICNTHEKPELELQHMEMLRTKQVDGIILASIFDNIKAIPKDKRVLYDGPIPVVCVDRKIDGLNRDLIETANKDVAFEATSYLLELGHRKIGVFGAGRPMITTVRDRVDGYRKAFRVKGIEVDEKYIETFDWEEEAVEKEIDEYLNKNEDITAILILNGSLTTAIFRELKLRSENWLNERSIITWDEEDMIQLMDITTVEQQVEKMGRIAAERIFTQVEHPERVEDGMKIVLKGHLNIRKSCKKR